MNYLDFWANVYLDNVDPYRDIYTEIRYFDELLSLIFFTRLKYLLSTFFYYVLIKKLGWTIRLLCNNKLDVKVIMEAQSSLNE